MLKVGITGGIGSGKSVVGKIIECLGFPVYYADVRANWIMQHNAIVQAGVRKHFGVEVFAGKEIDRAKLAAAVFESPELLAKLNKIVHPLVRADFERWKQAQTTAMIFSEAAIYFETGQYKKFNKMILVTAPVQIRIDRVMKRSQLTEDEVQKRMASQWTDGQKIPLADFVIVNDEETGVIEQVVAVLEALKVVY